MRLMRCLTGTLVIAGMTSLTYACAPAHAESMNTPGNTPGTFYAAQQDQTQPPKEDKHDKTRPQQENKEAKPPKESKQDRKAREKEQKESNKQGEQPGSRDQKQTRDEHGQARENNGGGHGRIPDRDFKAHFGQDHHFRVRQVITTTRIVPNQTQFVYSGYTFVFLDPWPDDWGLDDDCYVDYIGDEYVLIDVAHPGVQIALSVVL